MGVIFNGISQLGNEHLAVIRWPFFRGSVTVEVYVSSIRTRAFGRYIEGGCCRGVTVMRGSTVTCCSVEVVCTLNTFALPCKLVLLFESRLAPG